MDDSGSRGDNIAATVPVIQKDGTKYERNALRVDMCLYQRKDIKENAK